MSDVNEVLLLSGSVLWMGILTSVSPCPLATNILAVSFIGRMLVSPRKVLLAGLLYTLGRALGYVALGVLLVSSLLSAPAVSFFLQEHMNQILGPLLIFAGLVLLGLIRFNFGGSIVGVKIPSRLASRGLWGAVVLGILFALSFCPVSAALFFGSLIPMAVKTESAVILPSLYGIGTALPVVVFAVPIALGTRSAGNLFDKVTTIERWVRWITGGAFIAAGVYFSLVYIFDVTG